MQDQRAPDVGICHPHEHAVKARMQAMQMGSGQGWAGRFLACASSWKEAGMGRPLHACCLS